MQAKDLNDLQKDIQFYEYTKAANPVGRGSISLVPYAELLSELHETGPTRVIPFDLSDKLANEGPATSPNLLQPSSELRTGETFAPKSTLLPNSTTSFAVAAKAFVMVAR